MFRALQNYGNLSKVIQFDRRLPAGTEYLSPLLRAIKEHRQLKLHYYKFWDKNQQPVVRTIEPYLLKRRKALVCVGVGCGEESATGVWLG